jgi:nucleotide-binding universal stress UspA family protein
MAMSSDPSDDVPAHRTVTVGRTMSRSIVDVARRYGSETVVLRLRRRRKRLGGTVLGSTISHVVENAPADVVVVKTAEPVEPRSVLV